MKTKKYIVDLSPFSFYVKEFRERNIEAVMDQVRVADMGAFEGFVTVEVEDGRWLLYRTAADAERDDDNSLAVGDAWEAAKFPDRPYRVRGA